jgi:hypothetical protein
MVEMIAKLFSADVAICVASPEMYSGSLFPEEAAIVAKSRIKRRSARLSARPDMADRGSG